MDKSANKSPIRIGFLLIDDFSLISYSAAVEPLRAANLLADNLVYEICSLALNDVQSISSSGAIVPATHIKADCLGLDCLFVVAGGEPTTFDDLSALSWLRRLSLQKCIIGGISGGPVILVKAGIMEGRRMTVHWDHAAYLEQYKASIMVEKSLYVNDRGRLTCAGGTASMDMMHMLITDHHGAAFAFKVSDWLLQTEIRPAFGPQRASIIQRHGIHDEALVLAIEMMENYLGPPRSLSNLANAAGLGERQLNRLFHKRLGTSAMKFYRILRLNKGKDLLRNSTLNITEIALSLGFSSSAHFTTSFSSFFDLTPTEFRKSTPRIDLAPQYKINS